MTEMQSLGEMNDLVVGLFQETDAQKRTIVDLTRAIEHAVGARDTEAALQALACLRDMLHRHFQRQERAMTCLPRQEAARHRHEHQALVSGLGSIHGTILSESLARLNSQVAAYVNRIARHVVEHDAQLDDSRVAA